MHSNHGFIRIFLDNEVGRKWFLKKYLKNRPELFLSYYRQKPVSENCRSILILKTDAIGDYLLFRNYLEEISNHFRPIGYKVFLAGNLAWKDLALELDSCFLDGFFWLDRGGMNRKPDEKHQIQFLSEINEQTYYSLLYPNYSREWEAGDFLAGHIPCRNRFGFRGNLLNESQEQQEKGNNFYTHLHLADEGEKFEFLRNGEIVSFFLGSRSILPRPTLPHFKAKKNELRPLDNSYILIFPGASEASKCWPEENFVELIRLIADQNHLQIYLIGGKNEVELCKRIEEKCQGKAESLAGRTGLPELLEVISRAKFLISNDSAAIHMGAQCGVSSICIFRGNHFGRFLPYPETMAPNLKICTAELLGKHSQEIQSIPVSDVWKVVLEIDKVRQ